jgi:hypothetical protein
MYIEAEFYTFDHMIRGFVDTPQERLSDFLNIKNETTVVIKDAEISRLLGRGKSPPIKMSEARMEKHSILFAYPIQHDMTTKSIYRRALRQVYQVAVILPNFELVGSIYLTEKLEIRRVLLSRSDDFIPITEATAIYSLFPAITIWRNTIVFNKNRMILIGEHIPAENPFAAPEPPVSSPQTPPQTP